VKLLLSSKLAVAAVALGTSVGLARASSIVVIKSSDLGAYTEVATEVASGSRSSVAVVTLPADKRNGGAVRQVWEAKPDVIVAVGARALAVAAEEFPNIPVVFGMVGDPSQYIGDLGAAGVELLPSDRQVLGALRKVLPRAKEVTIVYDPGRSSEEVKRFVDAGRVLGISISTLEFSGAPASFDAKGSLSRSCDCIIIYPDPVMLSDTVFGSIVYEAFAQGLPALAYSSTFAAKGALMSVEADYASVARDLVDLAEQILAGRSPRSVGVHAPSRVKITVNGAVADELGITIPSEAGSSIEIIANESARR